MSDSDKLKELATKHGSEMVVMSRADWETIEQAIRTTAGTFQGIRLLSLARSPLRVEVVEYDIVIGDCDFCPEPAVVVHEGHNCCRHATCRLKAVPTVGSSSTT